jgi:agmatine/peptidylarginine deiminase
MRPVLVCVAVAAAVAPVPAEAAAPPAARETRDGLRVAAEWEPAVGVLIGWPLKLPRGLVTELAKDVALYVTVADKMHELKAGMTFRRWGIDPARVHFVLTRQGDGYFLTRDWGPFAVFADRGPLTLVDGRYLDYPLGRLGGKRLLWLSKLLGLDYRPDDAAPAAVAGQLGLRRRELPVALTGGNLFFDGQGTGFATQILLDENRAMGVSREKFLATLREELGVARFHVLPNFERSGFEGTGFGIHHADCLLKLLDEERILVKRAPRGHPDYQSVEAAVRHLAGLTNVYGRPYTLLRIDAPRYRKQELANYTNSLILNRKVYVPLFGIPADGAALRTWRGACPGYQVIGFAFDKGEDGWSYTDSLHCRTRAVWDPKMLHLTQAPRRRRPQGLQVCGRGAGPGLQRGGADRGPGATRLADGGRPPVDQGAAAAGRRQALLPGGDRRRPAGPGGRVLPVRGRPLRPPGVAAAVGAARFLLV